MRLLIRARNRTVAVEDGRIVADEGAFDLVIHCPDADVRPGLINAHDHLHRNHYGRLGKPPYRNAYQWADDIQHRYRRHIARGRQAPRRASLLTGAWKNLFAGVTSVVHHDRWEEDFDRDFPLTVVRVENADALGRPPMPTQPPESLFGLHVAEGVDEGAAEEVRTLARSGLLNERLVAVHGVGMDADGIDRFRASAAALVWCPTSNLFLFGRSAPPTLLNEGADVLLGSDSLLTGEGDLLDEIHSARALGLVDDNRLSDAVGIVAARRLGLREPSLEPGAKADLVVLDAPLLDARAENVCLVIAGGQPRVARADIAPRLGSLTAQGSTMTIGAVTRWISAGAADDIEGRP